MSMRKPHPKQRPLIADDLLDPCAEDYVHNLLLGTALRRLERDHVNAIEDIGAVRRWFRELCPASCRFRAEDDDDDCPCHAHVRHHLRQRLRRFPDPRDVRPPLSPISRNMDVLSEAMGLDADARAVLQFLLCLAGNRDLRRVSESLGGLTFSRFIATVGAAICVPENRVAELFAREGRLVGSGLLDLEPGDAWELNSRFSLRNGLAEALHSPMLDREGLLRRFLHFAPPPTLGWEDFAYVEADARVARDVVAGALRTEARGVNLLLHGPTGTGKSEFARLIAADVGARLFVAGGTDADDSSRDAGERLASLTFAARMARSDRAILLFDELEDLFHREFSFFADSHAVARMSKDFFATLLETNPLPTLWTTNSTQGMDAAFLRRFSLVLELRVPPPRQRARILARHLGPNAAVTAAEIDEVVNRHDASPAQLAAAVRTASLLSTDGRPDCAGITKVLAGAERLITGRDPAARPVFDPACFRLDVIHCRQDVAQVADALAAWRPTGRPGPSMCLYGPSGTGKSEFVRHLAWRMGRPVVYRRVSDIASMWVGETEANLARAFREAEGEGAVLLFDEADSFLRERRLAKAGWEVTQVNEFLQQIEAFPGVVACTTNLWRDIDEASLRRFVLKLEFGFLRPEQALTLFRTSCAAALSAGDERFVAERLGRMTNLAVGDFAAVRRRVEALGESPDAATLLELLGVEVAVKRTGCRTTIGF